jgi:hypothetical protein
VDTFPAGLQDERRGLSDSWRPGFVEQSPGTGRALTSFSSGQGFSGVWAA